jgi:hypothetical protein
MAITDILAAAQGGRYYANAAAACGLPEAEGRRSIERFAPGIASQLKAKAAGDAEAFEALLDLLEEGGDSSDLNDAEAMTGSEALADGTAILNEIYGSNAAALKALGAQGEEEAKAAALSATAVMATLAASNAAQLSSGAPQAAATEGGGLLSIILGALLKGLLQGAQRQLAPKRRRRRYTYSTRRRRTTTRRRKRTPGLDDIFKDILTGRK